MNRAASAVVLIVRPGRAFVYALERSLGAQASCLLLRDRVTGMPWELAHLAALLLAK